MTITIQNTVGLNATNTPGDVSAVKTRLVELGFNFLQPNSSMDALTIQTIKLFQAIKNGIDIVDKPQNDGRIDVNGDALKWLQAANAPRWTIMPAGTKAQGFVNDNIADPQDDHDFGTKWLADTLGDTGATYKSEYLTTHPNAAVLHINDTSLPHGGDTKAHKEHEAGLASDIRLPHKDGSVGGITFKDTVFDQAAMRAMLKAFLKQPLALKIFFNDRLLIAEGLCHFNEGHDNHAHFKIKPPTRVMP